jgi:hypothetical protein
MNVRKALSCDWRWRRGFKFIYDWIRPSESPFFRFRVFFREWMPYPGMYVQIKLGEKLHSIGIAATFRYSKKLLDMAEKTGETPYFLAGHTESI